MSFHLLDLTLVEDQNGVKFARLCYVDEKTEQGQMDALFLPLVGFLESVLPSEILARDGLDSPRVVCDDHLPEGW